MAVNITLIAVDSLVTMQQTAVGRPRTPVSPIFRGIAMDDTDRSLWLPICP